MAKVLINNTSFTMVLDGAGFCISDNEVKYAFGDTEPTDDDAFTLNPRSQVNSVYGKKLWAKSVNFESAYVTPIEE